MYIKTESPAKDMFREGTTGGATTADEIHLEQQCASEGIVEGVRSRGGHKIVPPQRATCPRRPSDGGQPRR